MARKHSETELLYLVTENLLHRLLEQQAFLDIQISRLTQAQHTLGEQLPQEQSSQQPAQKRKKKAAKRK